jgi:hypothetical protein
LDSSVGKALDSQAGRYWVRSCGASTTKGALCEIIKICRSFDHFHLFFKAIEVLQNNDPSETPLFLMLNYQAPHTPHQVPDDYLARCAGAVDVDRQTHCAMVAAMDEGMALGRVVRAVR